MIFSMGVAVLGLWAIPAHAATLKCPPDSVKVGTTCVDKYEGSIWQIPPSNTALVKLVQAGKATLAELTAGGATELGCVQGTQTPYPASFPVNGNWTAPVYAASVPGVLPSTCLSWFQAERGLRALEQAPRDEPGVAARGRRHARRRRIVQRRPLHRP
jgi:hypothetical protein